AVRRTPARKSTTIQRALARVLRWAVTAAAEAEASANSSAHQQLPLALRQALHEGSGRRPFPTVPEFAAVSPPGGYRLLQRRERSRDQQLVFLPDRADARLRRPVPALAGLLADARPFVRVLVDPDVHELVEPAELAAHACRERRELLALGHGLAPRLQHLRDVAGRVGVDAHLVEVAAAEVTAPERLHERRGDHDVRLLLHDQVASARQRTELLVVLHRLTDRHPPLQAVVRPHVDNLIERA